MEQTTPIPEPAQAQLDADELLVANVYDRVAPAVVRIETGEGLGSGYLIDTSGHIVTNNHVIASNRGGRVRVAFSGLFETIGEVLGVDADSDIAVVRAQEIPEGVRPVELGDSSQVRVGQRTILDILNAQAQLLTAQASLATAQRDRVVAAYSLLSAIGKLDIASLKIQVAAYDPVVHYEQVRDSWFGLRTPDGR